MKKLSRKIRRKIISSSIVVNINKYNRRKTKETAQVGTELTKHKLETLEFKQSSLMNLHTPRIALEPSSAIDEDIPKIVLQSSSSIKERIPKIVLQVSNPIKEGIPEIVLESSTSMKEAIPNIVLKSLTLVDMHSETIGLERLA